MEEEGLVIRVEPWEELGPLMGDTGGWSRDPGRGGAGSRDPGRVGVGSRDPGRVGMGRAEARRLGVGAGQAPAQWVWRPATGAEWPCLELGLLGGGEGSWGQGRASWPQPAPEELALVVTTVPRKRLPGLGQGQEMPARSALVGPTGQGSSHGCSGRALHSLCSVSLP